MIKSDKDFLNFIKKQKEEKMTLNGSTIDEDVIGMDKFAAILKIENEALQPRIVAEDGEHFMITMDHNPNRLNLEIVNGKVVAVNRG